MFAFSRCLRAAAFFARCAALVLAIAAPAQAEPLPAQIHPEAQKLIGTIEALQTKTDYLIRGEIEEQLWAEYKRSSYTANLSQQQKHLYDAALEAKDCEQVEKLQFAAFENTFPYIKPAFLSMQVYESHRHYLIGRMPDVMYCKDWHEMERILRLIKVYKLDLLPFDLYHRQGRPYLRDLKIGDTLPWLDVNPKLIDRARNSLCWNVRSLLRRATDDAHPHAVRDIMQLAQRDNEFRFSMAQLYAVYLRGMHLGILRDEDEKRLKQLYHLVKPKERAEIDTRIGQLQAWPGMLRFKTRRCRSPGLTVDELWGRE